MENTNGSEGFKPKNDAQSTGDTCCNETNPVVETQLFLMRQSGEMVRIEDFAMPEPPEQSDDIERVLAQEPHEVTLSVCNDKLVYDGRRWIEVEDWQDAHEAVKASQLKHRETDGAMLGTEPHEVTGKFVEIDGVLGRLVDDAKELGYEWRGPFAEKSEVEELKQRIEVLEHNSNKAKEAFQKLVEVVEILNKRGENRFK